MTVVLLFGRAVRAVHLEVALGVVALRRADLRPEDLAVGRDVDAHRAVDVVDEDRALEARPHGARAVGLLALAGRPADAADDLLDEVVVAAVLRVGGAEVTHGGQPDAAVVVRLRRGGAVVDRVAVVELAPGDRMVLAHRVARVVGALVERGQHVVRAAHAAREVVVLVAEPVRVGQVARREVVVVGDLDLGDVAVDRGAVALHQRADGRVVAAVPPVPADHARAHVGRVVVRRRCRRRPGRSG